MELLGDDRVKLNYVNLENDEIDPVTIMPTREEKIIRQFLPTIILNCLRRKENDKTN